MFRTSLIVVSSVAFCSAAGVANAGPCTKDAGSGPTVGATAQTGTTGTATQQHPPTAAMNSATQGKAASSQDAQRQEQGQPTASQQAMGANAKAAKNKQGC
jgi:hypothetical protein